MSGLLSARRLFTMIRITVPSYRKVGGEHERSFTVFCIEIHDHGRKRLIEKRYTEFEELHKELKKQVWTPEFPPKKVLKWNHKMLEHRRHGFEVYLQGLLHHHQEVPRALLQFLQVSETKTTLVDSVEQISEPCTISHQPVLAFGDNTFLQIPSGGLPDIVADGTIQGLYGSNDSVKS